MADDEDRTGKATKTTAHNFLAASQFFDVLAQFGEISNEIQEKKKYSKWKAADINGALKKGITPKPGGPSEEMEEKGDMENSSQLDIPSDIPSQPDIPSFNSSLSSFPPTTNSSIPSFPSPPNTTSNVYSVPSFPDVPNNTGSSGPPPTKLPGATPTPFVAVANTSNLNFPQISRQIPGGNKFTPSPSDLEFANKYAKFVVSSLQFDDVPAAIKNLKLCMKHLTGSETG